ncbi:hypothetical protein BHM03_00017389 [Ensete ventricosum]|nr:hypothetical protein BHM03_00017389 [Ensete ventricosum]
MMLSVASGNPLYPLRSFHGQPNRLVFRRSRAAIVERGSPRRPWRSYSSGSLDPSSSSSRSRWNARPPGAGGDPAVESRVGSGSSESPSTSFLSLLCPLLKFFGVRITLSSLAFLFLILIGGDPSQERNEFLEFVIFGSIFRFTLAQKDHCAIENWSGVLEGKNSKYLHSQSLIKHFEFPFLVDLNTGVSMYESSDIVKYLFRQYGQGRNPTFGLLER